jgi:putative FmdB family regulatory protein
LYEYRCTQCGHRFEKIQPFSADPETECPKCQGPLVRPLTAPAFQFKGAGWYVNDYASKSSSSAESAPESKPGADSKPAPAGESKAADSKAAESKPASAPASTSDSGSSKSGAASRSAAEARLGQRFFVVQIHDTTSPFADGGRSVKPASESSICAPQTAEAYDNSLKCLCSTPLRPR